MSVGLLIMPEKFLVTGCVFNFAISTILSTDLLYTGCSVESVRRHIAQGGVSR